MNGGPVARVRAHLDSAAGKAFITLADQGVVSATNFLTAVLVGRFAGTEELGLYYLGFQGILIFAQNTQMSLVSAAYIVYGPRLSGEDFRQYTGSTLLHYAALAVIAALGLLVAGLGLRATGVPQDMAGLDKVLLVMAGAVIFFLLREYARQVCFARLNAHAALVLDGFVLVAQVCGLMALGGLGVLTADRAYMVVGLACGAGGLTWLAARRQIFSPHMGRAWPDFRKNWRYSRWVFAMNLAFLGSMQIYPWLLVSFHGKEANGILGACATVIFLSNPFIIGMSNFLGPKCVHALTERGAPGLQQVVRTATAFFAVTMGGFCVIMLAGGGVALHLLFGDAELAAYGHVVSIWAVGQLAWALRAPAEYGLNAIERPDVGFKALLLMLLITVTAGVWLTWRYQAAGVAVGIAAGQTAACVYSRTVFARQVGGLLRRGHNTERDTTRGENR
ncbi:MAG: lipopolysaccharide biosynthesis protein [Candidatus Hydrogenedentota bacterium]